jgi:glutathione synthase/RimK-type ligase-like ATP-grasp enzyme
MTNLLKINVMYTVILLLILLVIFISLNNLLQNFTVENYTGLSTNDLLLEMKNNGYIIDEQNKTVKYCNNNECITKSYKKHFNTLDAIKLVKDKYNTSAILTKNGIPVPKFTKINSNDNIKNILNLMNKSKIYFPIVLKPINGTFGIDVITNIDNEEELIESISSLKQKYKELMLETQVRGDCYRIFVFNNKVIDVIKREKPYVIGDGIHTVSELIDKRNKEQEKMGLFQTKNVSNLFIIKQGFTLDTILDDKVKVYISNVINMHNGARISRIPLDTIPQKNIDMFINTNKFLKISCSGIDYLSDDITIEYDINDGKVLEVNGTPDTEIHTKIDYNKNEDGFFKRVVNNIF